MIALVHSVLKRRARLQQGIARGYAAALQCQTDQVPRAPSSAVRDTTAASAGSARKSLGSLQGAAGSAQVSSMAVGARMPSL